MNANKTLTLAIAILTAGLGCSTTPDANSEDIVSRVQSDATIHQENEIEETARDDDDSDDLNPAYEDSTSNNSDSSNDDALCNGEYISGEAVEEMIGLTELTNNETIYTIYRRIDQIALLFEDCGDPWGMFPTTYRHITRRIIQAIERGEIDDGAWGRQIVLDFAGRYLANLQAALTNNEPSFAWKHYYYLADRNDVSRTRAVVIAMIAHLTLDLPYSLVAVESTEDHKDDYFVLGELMIEITPDFIDDLRDFYDTDAGPFLTGFFIGDWVDGAFGQDTMITFSYQTIRTKSWNNRWYLETSWGAWIAESEIYTAFWSMDGVLATLDSTNAI